MSYLAEISYLATLRYKSFVFKEIFKILENSFFPPLDNCADVASSALLNKIVIEVNYRGRSFEVNQSAIDVNAIF